MLVIFCESHVIQMYPNHFKSSSIKCQRLKWVLLYFNVFSDSCSLQCLTFSQAHYALHVLNAVYIHKTFPSGQTCTEKSPPVSLYLRHASFMSINWFNSCERTHKIDELPKHKRTRFQRAQVERCKYKLQTVWCLCIVSCLFCILMQKKTSISTSVCTMWKATATVNVFKQAIMHKTV